MANKVKGASSAVGYWGRNINRRIDSEQTPEKIRALLQDKILSRGKDVFLWQEVTIDTAGSISCSCVKDTTDRADINCASCYGIKLIPGYHKFGHETLFMSSISPAITLSNISLDTDIKPYRLLISSGQLTGSITSSRLQYINNLNKDWDFRGDAASIKDTNTIAFSFSTDGVNFFPIEEINDAGKKPTGIGGIYLRVSMSRTAIDDRSPEFEILRVRHSKLVEPTIKILRPQVSEMPSWMQYGRRIENLSERFWTSPLDFFDPTIPVNTPAARIKDNAIYERITGINQGNRYVTTKPMYDEEFGIFTQQSFETRRSQNEEIYKSLVF